MTVSSSYQTPTIEPQAELPDIGDQLFSGERYYSEDYMRKEWTHLWRRTWNIGPRVEEFADTGDYVIHNLGKE